MNIKDKIQEKFSSLTDKQIYWLFACVLVAIFILDFLLLMQPQLNALSKINPKIKQLKSDIQTAQNNIAQINHYQSEVKRLQKEIDAVNKNVLQRQEVPLILEKISRMADENKVRIDQVMPDTTSQQLLLENSEKRYYALPISIEARTGYHNFGRFLDAMEHAKIYFHVVSFNISAVPNSKQHMLALTVDAVVYEDVSK